MSRPAKRSSPGLKGFSSCFMRGRSWPSAMMLTMNFAPGESSGSAALSFFTATESPGGSKLACAANDAVMRQSLRYGASERQTAVTEMGACLLLQSIC